MGKIALLLTSLAACGITISVVYLCVFANRQRDYIFENPVVSAPVFQTEFVCTISTAPPVLCSEIAANVSGVGYCSGEATKCRVDEDFYYTNVYIYIVSSSSTVSFSVSLTNESCNHNDGEEIYEYTSNLMPSETVAEYLTEHTDKCFPLYDYDCYPGATQCVSVGVMVCLFAIGSGLFILLVFGGFALADYCNRRKLAQLAQRKAKPTSKIVA